jgi:hypothetical protein
VTRQLNLLVPLLTTLRIPNEGHLQVFSRFHACAFYELEGDEVYSPNDMPLTIRTCILAVIMLNNNMLTIPQVPLQRRLEYFLL